MRVSCEGAGSMDPNRAGRHWTTDRTVAIVPASLAEAHDVLRFSTDFRA
jgi:hypothetical protein